MKKTSQPEKTQKPSIKSIEKKESEEKKVIHLIKNINAFLC